MTFLTDFLRCKIIIFSVLILYIVVIVKCSNCCIFQMLRNNYYNNKDEDTRLNVSVYNFDSIFEILKFAEF